MTGIKALLLIGLALVSSVAAKGSGGPVHVSGYTTKNGTYVAPYYRAAPGSGSSSSSSSGTGKPCGNSYIAAADVCHIGTPTTTASTFANCTDARSAGVHDIPRGDPAYSPALDRDNDGVACETGSNDDDVETAGVQSVSGSPVPAAALRIAPWTKLRLTYPAWLAYKLA